MVDRERYPTKAMFESLARLYKQGQLLLLDADRIMGERGWETKTTTIFEGLSYSLGSPDKWYIRWAGRFYYPVKSGEEEIRIDKIPFVSVHFAADHDTQLDEPIASAGWLLYSKRMDIKEAQKNCSYWMCKYWFWGEPKNGFEGWRTTSGEKWQNLTGTETFAVPLYEIKSSSILEDIVIKPLLDRYSPSEAGP